MRGVGRVFLAAGVVAWGGVAGADELPRFRDYPADAIEMLSPHVVPDLSSPDAYRYRTRIRDAAAQPANFAGHYSLAVWGCGSGCETGAVVDHFTGRVVLLPFSVCCSAKLGEPGFEAINFRPRSRLVVFAGQRNDEGEDALHFYEFADGAFKYIKSIPYDGKVAAAEATHGSVAPSVHADEAHSGCWSIKDDRERLACYDGAPPTTEQTHMSDPAPAPLASVAQPQPPKAPAPENSSATHQEKKIFGPSDLSAIHLTYAKNEARFVRDYVGSVFRGEMKVTSITGNLISSDTYSIRFEDGVYCSVGDSKTIDLITDLDKGDVVLVEGSIVDHILGDLELKDCSLTTKAELSKE